MLYRTKINSWVGLIVVFASMTVLSSGRVSAQRGSFTFDEVSIPDAATVDEISWRPDGALIAWAVGNDIRIYTPDLQEFARLEGHTDRVLSIDWSPDGTRLVSGGLDATIRIWDVETNENLEKGPSFGTTVSTWDDHNDSVEHVAWSPNGTRIASQEVDDSIKLMVEVGPSLSTTIWDVVSGEVIKQLPSYAGSNVLAWSPDSLQIVNAGESWSDGYGTRVWDVTTGDLLYSFSYNTSVLEDAKWNHTGQYLAILSDILFLHVADVANRQIFLSLNTIDTPISLSWSPDDTKIAVGDETGTLDIWDWATGQELKTIFRAHDGYIREVEWSSDGVHLATIGSDDKTLRIWTMNDLPNVRGTATATPNFDTPTPSPAARPIVISTPIHQ